MENRIVSANSRAVYARLNRKNYLIIAALIAFCALSTVLDVLTAAASPTYRLSAAEVINCLLHPAQASSATYVIVIKMDIKSMIKNKVKESALDTTIEKIVKEVSTKLKLNLKEDKIKSITKTISNKVKDIDVEKITKLAEEELKKLIK